MLYTQMRSFYAVATQGGFTAASKVLNIGQPTITNQVKGLEEYYGVELFYRRGRKVELTEDGRELFNYCRRIINVETEAKDYLNSLSGFHVGTLKIGAVGPYHLIEMVDHFNKIFPHVQLEVKINNSSRALERLLNYEVDIAVLAHVEDNPLIHAVPYSMHPLVLFVNTDHPLADRDELSVQELDGLDFIQREHGSTTRLAFDEALEEAGVEINTVLEIGSREAVWYAVLKGMGMAVVSDIEFIPHPNLKSIVLTGTDATTFAHVVCLQERRSSRLIKEFLKSLDTI